MRAVNAKWGEVGLNKGKNNKIARDLGTRAGTRQDNQGIEVPKQKKRGKKQLKDLKQDNKKAGNPEQKTRAKQDNKKAAKLIVKSCIGVERLLNRAFFLAVRLFYFLTFLFLKSVIG